MVVYLKRVIKAGNYLKVKQFPICCKTWLWEWGINCYTETWKFVPQGYCKARKYEDNYLTYPAEPLSLEEDGKKIKIGTGDFANNVRSFILNADLFPEEKNFTTWKSQSKGNQNENDYEKKCMLHNLPRSADFQLSNDSTINFANRRGTEIRNSLYIRKLYAHHNLSGYLTVSDPVRLHNFCSFAFQLNEADTSSPKNPLWANSLGAYSPTHNNLHEYSSNSDGNNAYPSMINNYINDVQFKKSGLPNILTSLLAQKFASEKNVYDYVRCGDDNKP